MRPPHTGACALLATICAFASLAPPVLARDTRTAATAGPLPPAGPARVAFPAGDYDFATVAQDPSGRPVCREHWVLAADGTAVQESGQEVIRSHWAAEAGQDGDSLHLSDRQGNGKPDCTGNVSGRHPSARLIRYMVTNGGDVMICAEPRRMADGALQENCYALLTRRPG